MGVAVTLLGIVGAVLAALAFTSDPLCWRSDCSSTNQPVGQVVVVSSFQAACADPSKFAFTDEMTCECEEWEQKVSCSDRVNKIFYNYFYSYGSFDKLESCNDKNR